MIMKWTTVSPFQIRHQDMIHRNLICIGKQDFINPLYMTVHFGIMIRYIQDRASAVRMKLTCQIIMTRHKRDTIYANAVMIRSRSVPIIGMVQAADRTIIISAMQKYCSIMLRHKMKRWARIYPCTMLLIKSGQEYNCLHWLLG